MKGEFIIDSKGEITSSLPLGHDETNEVGVLISNILQDINMFMRMNQQAMGDLKRTTLRLGQNHEVSIIVGADQIKAIVREISASGGVQ